MFKHANLRYSMPLFMQSNGTQSFIKLFPSLAHAFDNGNVLVIDELDAALHPIILSDTIKSFYMDSDKNPLNAQIWFSCHAASLLEDLVKEEIVICEKDRKGRTTFHSLMDVKVRRDENHYRKYLSGAYGGLPLIG